MRIKEGTMIFVQEICLLWNHEHRAVEVAMSPSIWLCSFLCETQTTVIPDDFYSLFVQSSSLLPWRKRKRKRRLFYLQIQCVLWCIAWSKEGALAQQGTMILLQERCVTQSNISFRCFLHMFVQSSCSSTKPICTLWSYIDVLNCLHCVMSPVVEAGLTPLLLSWAYQCSLPLSEALHIIWSRICYPFLLWCPEVLKFLLPCQNLLHC